MDEDRFTGQSQEDRDRLLQSSKVTILDSGQVEQEMMEKGYLTLEPGTRVTLNVGIEPDPLQYPGWIYWFDVGGDASHAPIECRVNRTSWESINPEQPETASVGLELTSPKIRRIRDISTRIKLELANLLPEPSEDDYSDLESQITNSPNPDRINTLLRADRRANQLRVLEEQNLAQQLLNQNPNLKKIVSGSPAGKFNIAGISLDVGTTTPIDFLKLTPSQPSPLPPPIP